MAKILIVEDEQVLRDGIAILLRANNYQVTEAENGQVALDRCAEDSFDLILLDLMMPVLDGIGFLKLVNVPDTKIVVLSNLSPTDIPEKLSKLGVCRQEIKANLSTREIVAMVKAELGEMPVSTSAVV